MPFCRKINKDAILHTLLGTEDREREYASKFIVESDRDHRPSKIGLYVMTALFVLVHFQTSSLDTLNQTSSYLGPDTPDHDVIGLIVTSSRCLGCLLGVVTSLVFGCRLAWPVLLYMIAVFSTALAMPSSKTDVLKICVCHVFQAFGTALIQTHTFFLVHKMWDSMRSKAIALQSLCTTASIASFISRCLVKFTPTRETILPSLSWVKNETDVSLFGVDGHLPSCAVVLSVSAILISAAILAMHQLFPLDCVMLSKTKPREVFASKYKTCLAFVFPPLAVVFATLNHVLVAQFSTNHIAVLSHHQAYANIAFILFTLVATAASVIVLNIIGTLTIRNILLTSSICQIAATISFLIGHNVTIVIATSINAMAMGTASIIAVALIWAMAFHNHIHILICTLVVSRSGLAEILYYIARTVLMDMQIGGNSGWIYLTSIISVLFFATAYLGNMIMEKLTKKEIREEMA